MIIIVHLFINNLNFLVMKKTILICVALLALFTTFSSCSKQDDDQYGGLLVENHEELAKADLMQELEAYNSNFLNNAFQTRSFFSWFKRFCRVAYVDAVGGIIGTLYGPWGTLAGAALSSGLVYCSDLVYVQPLPILTRGGGPILEDDDLEELGFLVDMNPYAMDYVILSNPSGMFADSVGYNHNYILMNLAENNNLTSTDLGISQMVNLCCNKADSLTNNGRGNATNSDLLNLMNYYQLKSLCQNLMYHNSFDDFVDAFINLYPQYSYELNFIKSYINTLCNIEQDENDGTYAQGVLTTISNSNVSNDLKKRLGDAVITGNASARLWKFD